MPPYREVIHFEVTVPAGTPVAAPLVQVLTMPVRVITAIDWRVPAGAQGCLGFRIGARAIPVVPQPAGTWVIAAGESGSFPLAGHHDSGDWSLIGYNTGTYPHTVYLTFHAELLERRPEERQVIPPWQLGPAPDLADLGPPVRRRK